jgi:hypothetical protein
MTTPSNIRKGILRHLNSVIWLQEWSIEDPLKPNPVIAGVTYPPNAIVEIPTESFDFSFSEVGSSDGIFSPVLCTIKSAYKIVWVFDRSRYPTFQSIPRRQIEDLVCKAGQFVMLSSQAIDEDILNIEVLRLASNNIGLKARPGNDVKSGSNQNTSWVIVCSIMFSISFRSQLDDFSSDAFDEIQPDNWTPIDGDEVIMIEEPFDLRGINIHINRSRLTSVQKEDPTTYELDEILEIRKIEED